MPLPLSPALDQIQHIDNPKSNRVLKWLLLVALVMFIGLVLAFWFGGTSFSDRDVVLLLDGPAQATAGDEVTYTLTYRNNTKVDLKELSFTFFYPEDSVVIASSGFSQTLTERFTVEKLSPKEEGTRQFRAFLIGDKGNTRDARTTLVFKAGSLSSSFEKEATLSTTITALPVPMTLSVPPSAVAGQDVNYVLDYRNGSDADISGLRFEFILPEGFTLKQATPNPTQDATWDVPTLKQGQGARITLRGTLQGNERDTKEVAVTLKRKVNDTYVNYERTSASTILSSPLLGLSIVANNSRDYIAMIGDRLTYTVSFRNTSRYSLVGLVLTVKLDGDMYDLNTVDASGGSFDQGTRTITWNAGSVPSFGNFLSGTSNSVQFRVALKQSLPTVSGARSFSVKATATLGTTNVPIGLDGEEVSVQDSTTTKISTQPTLKPVVYYDDPAFGSSGPLPPEVGKETLFTVHWQVLNPGNDVTGAIVRGTLPTGVTWKNVMSTGTGQSQPVYDKNTSQVTWNIGFLPQGTGVTTPKYEASFQVGIVPSPSQRNTSAPLVRNLSLSGTDAFTKQQVLQNIDQVTTSDTIDRPEDGTVQ